MIVLAYILSGLSLLMGVLFLVDLRSGMGWMVLLPKLTAAAFSPFGAIVGIAGAVFGWAYQAIPAIPMGIVGAVMMIAYVVQCSRDHTGFEDAFGADWPDRITPEQASQMVKRRWTPFLPMNASPEPTWERDVAFWTVPGTDRELLCDIWHPADGDASGLAFIYFHGSGWWAFDKDMLTRSFFRHLVAQGHTVMDVAYRLCPEVDIYGMIGDVKRAVAWMKANADRYGVNPEKIVLAGGSAGGHLSLLAGYAPQHPELTPEEIKDADLSVSGIISYYGPNDLLASYRELKLQQLEDLPPIPAGSSPDYAKSMRDAGRMDTLLGGWPRDVPHMYQLASPIYHVHPDCPPTLLIQGAQDLVTPVDATRELHTKLVEAGVPSVNVVFPWTEHGFDLAFPQVNPAAQSALYDVDRFLALLVNKDSGVRQQPKS